ncbi:DUF6603 domain-containing protein [Priestia megaterium]|uniref:DUF6603 domain-containing protein n=1 Tax=Priestia megaterium TaxID=1404 RepID=UPI002FFDE972
MGLNELKLEFEKQVQSNQVVRIKADVLKRASLQPIDNFDELITKHLLLQGEFIVSEPSFPSGSDNDQLFLDGKIKFLNLSSSVDAHLIFTVHTDLKVELFIEFITDGWSIQKSFPELDMFPFSNIQLDQQRFCFTTMLEENYQYAGKNITLQQGLSLVAHLIMGFWANKVSELFAGGIKGSEKFPIYGSFDCSKLDNSSNIVPRLDWKCQFEKKIEPKIIGEWSNPLIRINSNGNVDKTKVSFGMSLRIGSSLTTGMVVELTEIGKPIFLISYTWETPDHPEELNLSDLLEVLIPELYIPKGLNMTLGDANFNYDLIKRQMVLQGRSKRYGDEKAILVGLEFERDWKFYFATKFERSFQINDLPIIGEIGSFLSTNKIMFIMASNDLVGGSDLALQINQLIVIDQDLKIKDDSTIKEGSILTMDIGMAGMQGKSLLIEENSCMYNTDLNKGINEKKENQTDLLLHRNGTSIIVPIPSPGNIGPVKIHKAGVAYCDGELQFLFEVSLTASSLVLSLKGFTVGFSLEQGQLGMSLEGLGVSFESGPLKISGTLLGTLKPVNFTGSLVISTSEFSIYALGGYTQIDKNPSLFVYAVLNKPLGGPVFFFVTGLAAGFGFNRSLQIPEDVEGVSEFPFVQWASDNSENPPPGMGGEISERVTDTLNRLIHEGVVEPVLGKHWLAFGIRFTSFEFINSFALLTMSFPENEMDMLGYSTLKFPRSGSEFSTFAEAEFKLKAKFSQKQGFVEVLGNLDHAYVFSKDCSLEGDFAYSYWFDGENAGDFLVSLGGFHPNYKLAHYPDLDRLSMNWAITNYFHIKGDSYFAMDSKAIMGGLNFDASWGTSGISAGFSVNADFLMVYAPYRYYFSSDISFDIKGKFKILGKKVEKSFHIGADLEIWGPSFSLYARVENWLFGIDIKYGRAPRGGDKFIRWGEFVNELLPKKEEGNQEPEILRLDILKGLVSKLDQSWLINKNDVELAIRTAIPLKEYLICDEIIEHPNLQSNFNRDFGVGPTGTSNGHFKSHLTVTLNRLNGDPCISFIASPILSSVPKGMWEYRSYSGKIPDISKGSATIKNVLTGFRLVPSSGEKSVQLDSMKLKYLLVDSIEKCWQWNVPHYMRDDPFDCKVDTVENSILSDAVLQNRPKILAAINNYGFSVKNEIDISDLANPSSNDLMNQPQLHHLGEQKLWTVPCVLSN